MRIPRSVPLSGEHWTYIFGSTRYCARICHHTITHPPLTPSESAGNKNFLLEQSPPSWWHFPPCLFHHFVAQFHLWRDKNSQWATTLPCLCQFRKSDSDCDYMSLKEKSRISFDRWLRETIPNLAPEVGQLYLTKGEMTDTLGSLFLSGMQ